MNKVIITIEGGLIQHVEAPLGVVIEVLDFDTDYGDEKELCHCPLAAGGEMHFHATFGEEQSL